ncbi:hypothetical protein FPSE5266_03731 [Fusarium pseudograminearum]|nr:hypothetical protein FPSE5266_03731 [Fusarium pseudograminearum]
MQKCLPSENWTSYNDWNWGNMRDRLEERVSTLNMEYLKQHAETITGHTVTLSPKFSAGQYWVCFELLVADRGLIIARVRLPQHPTTPTLTEEDESYAAKCEIATMRFVKQRLPGLIVPDVYTYQGPGSPGALQVGAPYMLIEGFYGTSLEHVVYGDDGSTNFNNLSASEQEHVIAQWTWVQAMLATLTFPEIGSICDITEAGGAVIGKPSSSAVERHTPPGPFKTAIDFFTAFGEGALRIAQQSDGTEGESNLSILGARVFLDIVRSTPLFQDNGPYHLNHMDLHLGNILVDRHLNFLAIIDWEFAQTAPWQVNYYPMPFPLGGMDDDIESILQDPSHIAHENVKLAAASRHVYCRKFDEAAANLAQQGKHLSGSYSEVLEGAASRIYASFIDMIQQPERAQHFINGMVNLAFGFDAEQTKQYLESLS